MKLITHQLASATQKQGTTKTEQRQLALDVKLQNRLFILFISIWMMAGIDIIYLQIFLPPCYLIQVLSFKNVFNNCFKTVFYTLSSLYSTI